MTDTDLVARLRAWVAEWDPTNNGLCAQAADRIEGLTIICTADPESNAAKLLAAEAENKRLREALEGIASFPCCQTPGCSVEDPNCDSMIARAALKTEE